MRTNIFQKFKHILLSLELLAVLLFAIFAGNSISAETKAMFYTLSLLLKEVILFILPFIIIICLFNSLASNKKKAVQFVGLLLVLVCISNFLSILAAYGFGKFAFQIFNISLPQVSGTLESSLTPIIEFHLPKILSNEQALFTGLIVGLLACLIPSQKPVQLAKKLNKFVSLFLEKFVIPQLPLFALGFVLNMQHQGMLKIILIHYAPIIGIIVAANLIYLSIMFLCAAGFQGRTFLQYLKNVIPVGLLGFSTMSSLATMPVTLVAAEKNTQDPELARAIIPSTANIHMIGDSISIPIVAMGVMLTFGLALPSFSTYLLFAYFFLLVKFSVPGVPCGTILIMLPLFEKYFGFSSEMSGFIATIYILFDTIVTAGNVLGNSAFVIIVSKIMKAFSINIGKNKEPENLTLDPNFDNN